MVYCHLGKVKMEYGYWEIILPEWSLNFYCVLPCKVIFKSESSHCSDIDDGVHCNLHGNRSECYKTHTCAVFWLIWLLEPQYNNGLPISF